MLGLQKNPFRIPPHAPTFVDSFRSSRESRDETADSTYAMGGAGEGACPGSCNPTRLSGTKNPRSTGKVEMEARAGGAPRATTNNVQFNMAEVVVGTHMHANGHAAAGE